jgi:nucleoside 2-deoxyribosyltransferase
MRKIYLAGPMSGLPEFNFPAFNTEAARLRSLGFNVVNPAEINRPGEARVECLRRDIPELLKCDTVAFLPGWEDSEGARMELCIARQLEMLVVLAEDIGRNEMRVSE